MASKPRVKLDTGKILEFAEVEGVKALQIGAERIKSTAYRLCPVGKITRTDSYKDRNVSFWGRKSRRSKTYVQVKFKAKDVWQGRKPGTLRASIRITSYDRKGRFNKRVWAGSKQVYYAHMVEYGSVHNKKPANFMRGARKKEIRTINNLMKQAAKTACDRANQLEK